MNRSQKMARWMVLWMGAGTITAGIAVLILYAVVGFPKAWSVSGFLGISGLAGLAPLLFRKDPGPVQFDERDRVIQLKSARAGFALSYLVFGLLAMGIWTYCRRHGMTTVSIEVLPMIWGLAVITVCFFYSLMILLLYGKDKHMAEGEAL